MKGLKRSIFAIGLLLTFGSALAQTGVVFIHGKGRSALANKEVAWAYWGDHILSKVTRGFTVPLHVVHYDGELPIAMAAKETAAQIADFIEVNSLTSIIVESHSFGGVVIRWVLSNPDLNQDFATVAKLVSTINAIAPPNAGSKAADMAGEMEGSSLTEWLIEFTGNDNESTRNLQTVEMAYFNEHFLNGTVGRPPLSAGYYTIAGTDTWNDWYAFHEESYHDVMLGTLSPLAGFEGDNDGMVSVKSVEAVGMRWYNTHANHSHNRRSTFDGKIAKLLASDLAE